MNEQENTTNSKEYNSIELIDDNDELLIPEKFISKDERNKITFTKNGIIKFLNEIAKETTSKWVPLFNKDGLILHYRTGVNIFYY